jgi:hypothetical protein
MLVGFGVDARATVAVALELKTGGLRFCRVNGPRRSVVNCLEGLPGPVLATCQARPVGYGLAREAAARGIEVRVCAAGSIPRKPGDRINTDRRYAERLARSLLAVGAVVVRARRDRRGGAVRGLGALPRAARADLMRARYRLSKFLLRKEIEFPRTRWQLGRGALEVGLRAGARGGGALAASARVRRPRVAVGPKRLPTRSRPARVRDWLALPATPAQTVPTTATEARQARQRRHDRDRPRTHKLRLGGRANSDRHSPTPTPRSSRRCRGDTGTPPHRPRRRGPRARAASSENQPPGRPRPLQDCEPRDESALIRYPALAYQAEQHSTPQSPRPVPPREHRQPNQPRNPVR